MKKNSKGLVPIVIVIIITVIAGILVSAGWYYQKNKNEPLSNTSITTVNKIQFPDAKVDITCAGNEDCKIVDSTKSVGDCFPTPECNNWYIRDNYVAVNNVSYTNARNNLTSINQCKTAGWMEYPPLSCPPDQPYAKAECQNNVCVKVNINTETQIYRERVTGGQICEKTSDCWQYDITGTTNNCTFGNITGEPERLLKNKDYFFNQTGSQCIDNICELVCNTYTTL